RIFFGPFAWIFSCRLIVFSFHFHMCGVQGSRVQKFNASLPTLNLEPLNHISLTRTQSFRSLPLPEFGCIENVNSTSIFLHGLDHVLGATGAVSALAIPQANKPDFVRSPSKGRI